MTSNPLILWVFALAFAVSIEANSQQLPPTEAKPPSYRGGKDMLIAFIINNIQYPDDAKSQGLQGIVYIDALVRVNGRLDSLNIIYSRSKQIEESLGLEALRVTKLMPNWIPASDKTGRNVDQRVLIPFRFKLSPDR